MEMFFEVLHVIVAIFMIFVVLVQGGNSGGVGAAFGGGNSSGVFGATGATSFFGKLTYAAAAIFMLTSITLTRIKSTDGDINLEEQLKEKAATSEISTSTQEEAPVPKESPAATK